MRNGLHLCAPAAAVTLAWLAALGAPEMASARSCGIDPTNSPREAVHNAEAAFVGTLVQRTDQMSDDSRERGQLSRYRVERVYKGSLGPEVTVYRDEFSLLDERVGNRRVLLVDRSGAHYSEPFCAHSPSIRELTDALRPLPAGRGGGPVRFLIAGGFGAPDVIALDGRGRTLGYGTARGALLDMSVCPGGRRSVEITSAVVDRRFQRRLYVRDLRTLRVLHRVLLDGDPDAASCRSSDAREIIALAAADGTVNGRSRLVKISGRARRALHRGQATNGAIARDYAWLSGEPRGGLTRVDLRSGRARRVNAAVHFSDDLAVSPSGRQAAVAHVDGVRVFDGSGVKAKRGALSDPVWTDERTLVVSFGGPDHARLAVNTRLRWISDIDKSVFSISTGHQGRLLTINSASGSGVGGTGLSAIRPRQGRAQRLARLPSEGTSLLVAVSGATRLSTSARRAPSR